jgi:predicted acyl esterase
MRKTRVFVISLFSVSLIVACSNAKTGTSESGGATSTTVSTDAGAPATFKARGSVNQVVVTGAKPDSKLQLRTAKDRVAESGTADENGALIFRLVTAGHGYTVRETQSGATSEKITVLTEAESAPPQSFYSDQHLERGFHYITTRDGTQLSASVFIPPGDGPFPTVVEYSGYNPSDPTASLKKTIEKVGLKPDELCVDIAVICSTPAQPSSMISFAMGYAVVAVNVRGTGCSDGAYDFFEPLQLLDGYDVIETVAAQPWVKGNKVGMVGLSYPGLSQLFVARTQPPHLAAIAPMSVTDDIVRALLAPGGIYNDGFALEWARKVLEQAEPYGQGWEKKVIANGDTECADHQLLRKQNVNVVAKAKATPYWSEDIAGLYDIGSWADRINVPVFMTGAWQDEQTGPRFTRLWDRLTNSPVKKFTGFNGAHGDGYSPETLVEWKAFLDFYVAGERTPIPGFLRAFGPQLIGDAFKSTLEFPEERWIDGEFATLKAQFEAEPSVRILWDRGARTDNIGAPESTGQTLFTAWPPAGQHPQSWYFQPDGTLGNEPPTATGSASRFTLDPEQGTQQTLPGKLGEQAFHTLPQYQWEQDATDHAAVFVSAPLAQDTVILGGGRANLWVRSSGPKADLSVTISEVRPDGKETYVQSGFLRASMRKTGPAATDLYPDHTGTKADASPLPIGKWTEVPIEVLPVGQVFRAGSKIRISVHTPGGDKPRWDWILDDFGPEAPTIDIGHDSEHPSALVLPVVPNVTGYSPTLPPCPSLRGQPCREYVAFTNTAAH